MYEVIFDLETKKFFDDTGTTNPADLGVSIVSLYARQIDDNFTEIKGEMLSFFEKDFDSMWKCFLEADRIIGFNSLGFDVPALSPYAPSQWSKLPHFDILARIRDVTGRRISLNKVAQSSLGTSKIDSGSNAILYWNKGDQESLSLLQKYCEADVAITRDVYDYVLKNKTLKFIDHWNTPREIELDFSYSENQNTTTQTALF